MPTTEGWPRRPTTLRTAVVLGSNGHPPRKSPHVGAPVWRRHGCAYPLALQGGVVHVLDVAESRRRASDRGAGWVRRSPPAPPRNPRCQRTTGGTLCTRTARPHSPHPLRDLLNSHRDGSGPENYRNPLTAGSTHALD
jgi:hypothetical protein